MNIAILTAMLQYWGYRTPDLTVTWEGGGLYSNVCEEEGGGDRVN